MSNLIVYNASAGSGKTFTLAVEFISLCVQNRNPHYFRHILAITFTNKAAHELKERIIQFTQDIAEGKASASLIQEILKRVEVDESELKLRADKLHKAMLYHYSDLHVSTIDSFILSVLRSFSKEIGLPFDFDVELDQEKIMDLLIENILSSIGKDEFITEQLVAWSTQNLDEDKGWNPKGNMKKALSHLFQEESIPFRKKLLELTEGNLKSELENLRSRRLELISQIQEVQKNSRRLLGQAGLELDDMNRKASGFISFTFKDYTSTKPPTQAHLDIVTDGNLLSADGKKAGKEAQAESIREHLATALGKVKSWAEELGSLDRYYRNRMSLILALRLEALIKHLEKEEGMSILQDNNAKVAQLIGQNPAPFIYERVGERFKHFLIDEFQDTSVLQWRNMLPLIENSLSTGKKNFLVGDAKQSIYRWRGGEVDQLVEIPKIPNSEKSVRLKEIEDFFRQNFTQSISLKNNYRSSTAIIEFNNGLFQSLAPSLSEKYKTSYQDSDQHITRDTRGFVRMTTLPEKTELEESLEVMHQQIEKCVSEGYTGSDICILVRTNREGRTIAKSLEERGYNISSPDALLLSSHADVRLLVSLLDLLSGAENHRNQLYAIYRLLERAERLSELMKWNQELKKNGALSTIANLMASLDLPWEFEKLQNKDPYSALTLLVDVLSLEPNDAYIQELLNQASGFGNSREATMIGFISYWEDKKNSLSVKAGVNPKSIQLMTIHRSKGLQFPVVILPLISWKGTKNGKDKEWVDLGGDPLTVGLVNVTQALENTALREAYKKEKEKSDLDKMNLLYVALTRAENRMYLQVSDPGIKGIGKVLSEYVYQHGEDGKLEYGAEEKKSIDKTIESESSVLKPYEKNKRDDLLSVALSKEDKNRRQRDFGESVHKLLETVKADGELDDIMRKLMPDDIYSTEERDRAGSAFKAARKLESQLELEQNAFKEAMEIDLMDEEGKSYRIDKLFLNEQEKRAVIIDYKTGEQRESDQGQMGRYKEVLKDMGYTDVQAFLIYTETDELIPA